MQPQAPSEIDKAIELLIALKSARPASFESAMARISAAPRPGEGEEAAHASSLALGLLKGPFGPDSSAMLVDLAAKLPRRSGGALGLATRSGAEPASLASRALRMHKLGSPWARFLMRAMRDGALPVDRECAFELAGRLQMTVEEDESSFDWLGSPDEFHEALGAFFQLDCDWALLSEQTGLDFLPWILSHWLHEGSAASFGSALSSCARLMAAGAVSGLSPASWLQFARPDHSEHAAASLAAMSQCLLHSLPELSAQGASPCLMFCKSAYPTPWMAQALEAVLALDPEGIRKLDEEGLSCAYFLNLRLVDHESSEWQGPLLESFDALLRAGADPRSIAPQRGVASLAKHPRIAAAVEAALIAEQTGGGRGKSRKAL